MAAAKKPMPKKTVPKKPMPKKTVVKPKPPVGPMFYSKDGKPDPKGHYDKDGFMVKVPGKKDKFEKTSPAGKRSKAEIEAAKKSGYAS